MFDSYLKKWHLFVDGEPIVTHSSHLLPVRTDNNLPAMLKIALSEEEKYGNLLMRWWDGDGAARVYAFEHGALLMERAEGSGSLMRMALDGCDDEASRIACKTIARLHASRPAPLPELVPLDQWFGSLKFMAARDGGILTQCVSTLEELLASPREVGVLHGDIHHDNILDFGERGWLAIDPKRLLGERGFEYANMICNPDLPTVTDPARFTRQVAVIAQAAQLEERRLLQWVLVCAGLSAAWFLEDDETEMVAQDLQVAHLAAQALSIPG